MSGSGPAGGGVKLEAFLTKKAMSEAKENISDGDYVTVEGFRDAKGHLIRYRVRHTISGFVLDAVSPVRGKQL